MGALPETGSSGINGTLTNGPVWVAGYSFVSPPVVALTAPDSGTIVTNPVNVLFLASATDRLVGIEGARRIADGLKHARYAEIPSDRGHRAVRAPPGTSEADFIDRQIHSFLALPRAAGK